MPQKSRHCEICRELIDPGRVEALPDTRLCVEHAKLIGKYGGEFLFTGAQASLGKPGSLKKNYGDVSVAKKRNTEGLRKLRDEYEQGRTT